MIRSAHLSLLAVTALAGCSLAPDYKPPAIATPIAYKEAGPWVPAEPSDDLPRRDWWKDFGDPTLHLVRNFIRIVPHKEDKNRARVRHYPLHPTLREMGLLDVRHIFDDSPERVHQICLDRLRWPADINSCLRWNEIAHFLYDPFLSRIVHPHPQCA